MLVGSGYWGGLIAWLREKVLAEGKISASDLGLLTVVDSAEEVVRAITQAHAEAGLDAAQIREMDA